MQISYVVFKLVLIIGNDESECEIEMGVKTKLVVQGVIASLIRLWLAFSEYKRPISDRVEISTPLNSWKRVTEGVYLLNDDGNPYVGDLIHEPPVNLYLYKLLIYYTSEYLPCVFIICDVCTAFLLYLVTNRYLKLSYQRQTKALEENKKYVDSLDDARRAEIKAECQKSDDNLFLTTESIKLPPTYVFAAYLFNPYIIFNCVAMTTTVFSNMFLAVFLCSLVFKVTFVSCLSLALSTIQSLYSGLFFLPIVLSIEKGKNYKLRIFSTIVLFFGLIGCLQYLSYVLCGNWGYLENTYGFILFIPDLQPNIGLFWYFFTEMFEHFRALFISAFQINVTFLYLIPLSIRFRKDPLLLAASLIILTAIFKSYPSLGDIGFCLSLIPIWTYLFGYLQQGFVVICCFLVTSVLGPVVWHLWIYSRSANANFYFGVTLSFATAQIFLITDLLFAYIKTDFWLKNNHVRNIDSNAARLTLE